MSLASMHIIAFRAVSNEFEAEVMEFQLTAIFLIITLAQYTSARLFPDGLLSKMECVNEAFWQFFDSRLWGGDNHNTASLQQNEKENNNLKINGTTSTSGEDCYTNEVTTSIFGCPSRVEETWDSYRIPKVMSSVRCLQASISSNLFRPIGNNCEEVNLQVPVLRKNANCLDGPNKYALVWETVSVACVRTVLPSAIRSKQAHRIILRAPF